MKAPYLCVQPQHGNRWLVQDSSVFLSFTIQLVILTFSAPHTAQSYIPQSRWTPFLVEEEKGEKERWEEGNRVPSLCCQHILRNLISHRLGQIQLSFVSLAKQHIPFLSLFSHPSNGGNDTDFWTLNGTVDLAHRDIFSPACLSSLPSSFFSCLMESLSTELYFSNQTDVSPTPALQVCALFGRVAMRQGCEWQTHQLLQFPLLAYKRHLHPNSDSRADFFSDVLVHLKIKWWEHWDVRERDELTAGESFPSPQNSRSRPCEEGLVHCSPKAKGVPLAPRSQSLGDGPSRLPWVCGIPSLCALPCRSGSHRRPSQLPVNISLTCPFF